MCFFSSSSSSDPSSFDNGYELDKKQLENVYTGNRIELADDNGYYDNEPIDNTIPGAPGAMGTNSGVGLRIKVTSPWSAFVATVVPEISYNGDIKVESETETTTSTTSNTDTLLYILIIAGGYACQLFFAFQTSQNHVFFHLLSPTWRYKSDDEFLIR